MALHLRFSLKILGKRCSLSASLYGTNKRHAMHTEVMRFDKNIKTIFYRKFANVGEQGNSEQVKIVNTPLYTSQNLATTAHSLQKLCTAEYG